MTAASTNGAAVVWGGPIDITPSGRDPDGFKDVRRASGVCCDDDRTAGTSHEKRKCYAAALIELHAIVNLAQSDSSSSSRSILLLLFPLAPRPQDSGADSGIAAAFPPLLPQSNLQPH